MPKDLVIDHVNFVVNQEGLKVAARVHPKGHKEFMRSETVVVPLEKLPQHVKAAIAKVTTHCKKIAREALKEGVGS